MNIFMKKLNNGQEAFTESKQTIVWIWKDLIDHTGRQRGIRSLYLLMLATLLLLGSTYATKEAIDALTETDKGRATYWVLIGGVVFHLSSRITMAWHAHERELAWNSNHFNVRNRLNVLFFDRTMAELATEESDVGPEQIEAAQNRIDNLLHLILFNVAPALVTIVISITLMTTVDVIAAASMATLLGFNIAWFLYYNEAINTKMTPVDKEFRRISNRVGEYWHLFQSTKTSGVENKVCANIAHELAAVLKKDKAIWADWFVWLDVRRSVVNIAGYVGIMLYGIHYGTWSTGDYAAITIWSAMVGEKFSVIGTLMRHLTECTTRLKAIRIALTTPPAFNRHEGIIYQPTGGNYAPKA